VLCFFLLFLNLCYAEDNSGRITGKVIDLTNDGLISYTKIKLESETVTLNYRAETNSDLIGNFEFRNIPAGMYKISTNRLGYEKEEITEIQVTANEVKTTLKQTPSSISIVSAEDIRNRNPLTFDDVLSDVQGVTIFKTSGINVQSLSIRGSSDVAGGGIGNRVLLLLDGRPSLTGDSKGALWSLIPVSIIERTEVVKGAFSSLYGSSAIGGVVNVITKKPTYKAFTSLNLNYGFYNPLNDSLKFTDKLLSFKSADVIHSNTYKKLAYLLNFNYKQNDGHAQQTDYEFYGGLAKLMYDVFRNRDLEVTLQFTKSNSAFPHYWRKDPGKVADPYKSAPGYLGDRIKKETQSLDVFYTAIPSANTKYTSRFYYYKLFSLSYFNPNNFVAQQYAPPGQALLTTIES